MHILFCIDSLTGGGAEKLLLRYINILKKHIDCDITLFIVSGYGALMECIPANIRVFTGSDLSDEDARDFDSLIFDIEIGFLEGRAMKFVALRSTTALKVGWIHTDMLHNNWCQNYYQLGMQEIMYDTMDYIVCINKYCSQQFNFAFPNISNKVLVCNNILDFTELDEVTKHTANQDNLKQGIINLCFVGRLTQEKHPDVAIMAVKHLIDHGYNAYLSVLGEGYLYDNLKKLIRDHGLEKNVKLLGYHPKPYSIMATCDLLISVSDIEGGPLNIAEAYYLGVPSISSHSGGSDDFANQFGGLTYTEISPTVLANEIAALLTNNGTKYLQLKAQIHCEFIKKHYSAEALLAMFNCWKQEQLERTITNVSIN